MRAGSREHGGGLDAATKRYGGARQEWLDLSTGINPQPYPLPELSSGTWTDLPDAAAADSLERAARKFWDVPDSLGILATPGASSIIARLPGILGRRSVSIPGPTYNEHEAAFRSAGWNITDDAPEVLVIVHPNNPDGRLHNPAMRGQDCTVVDESFCDVMPERSFLKKGPFQSTIILKSFGKFWGLAGLRLGFAIADQRILARLSDALGPWPVSGPALQIGTIALNDHAWAAETRERLARDAERLDRLMTRAGARVLGGTTLFRLFEVDDAAIWQDRLARNHIWSRNFSYNRQWLRLGLPGPNGWKRLEEAL